MDSRFFLHLCPRAHCPITTLLSLQQPFSLTPLDLSIYSLHDRNRDGNNPTNNNTCQAPSIAHMERKTNAGRISSPDPCIRLTTRSTSTSVELTFKQCSRSRSPVAHGATLRVPSGRRGKPEETKLIEMPRLKDIYENPTSTRTHRQPMLVDQQSTISIFPFGKGPADPNHQ